MMLGNGARRCLIAVISSTVLAMAVSAQADIIYMRSDVGQPWGLSGNENALDAVFGVGGWQDLRYETVDPLAAFSSSNAFAFLEGSDETADELEAFLSSNLATIEAWVAAGGRLFLNSAPNEGDGMSFGFGGIELVYPDTPDDPVSAVDPSHPIFNGPFATTTSFTGDWFAHATVIGPGLSPILEDASGVVYLAELNYGLGHVLVGGMTDPFFHEPDPEAANLRANILAYGASQPDIVSAVPEPSSLALLSIGAIGMVAYVSRRRRRAASSAV